MFKLRKITNLLLSSALLLGNFLVTLSSCSREIDVSEYTLSTEEDFVNLSVNESKTLQIYTNFSNISFSISDENMVRVTLEGSTLTIQAIARSGSTYVRIFKSDDPTIFKDILVVINSTSSSNNAYHLGINDSYRTEYYLYEVPSFDDLGIYVYQDTNPTNRILLNRNEYYFSVSTTTGLEVLGEQEVTIFAPEYTDETISFSINVIENDYYKLMHLFSNLIETNNYSMSFRTTYGPILNISGEIYKTDNYFVNTYRDNFIIDHNNNLFVGSFTYDNDGEINGVRTQNGVIDNLVGGNTLENAVSKLYGISTLANFNIDTISEDNIENGRYIVNNSSMLSLFWNQVLGFNGSGTKIYLSTYQEGIVYTIEGHLNSGISLTFEGTIYDIGSSSYEIIDEYLMTNYTINEVTSSEVTTIVNALKAFNYTYSSGSTSYKFTSNYIEITSGENVSGYIKLVDGIHTFTINSENNIVLGDFVEDVENLADLINNPANLPLFNEFSYKFIESTYYGGYLSLDSKLNSEVVELFFPTLAQNYQIYGLAISLEDGIFDLTCFYNTSSGAIGGSYMRYTNVGSTSSEILDDYLASL